MGSSVVVVLFIVVFAALVIYRARRK